MTNTIVASSHSVRSDRSSLRAMKRAIAWSRAVPSDGWVTRGRRLVPSPLRAAASGTFEVDEKDIWPRALEKTPSNLFELPAR